jgi:acyl-CoA reductase-like NAD-dependent aldehyde dehydrogenase
MSTPNQQFERLNTSPNLDLETRKNRLKSLKKAIKAHTDDIIKALNQDYGQRNEQETRLAEIMICLDEINHTLKHVDAWVKPVKKMASYKFMFSKVATIPQALGTVGIISPWNYPFNLAIAPMVAAIAAGNKVMLKPSEVTPKTSDLIAKICSEVFKDTEVAVSLGGVEVAQEFSSLPFKHLLFTGSTAVGKIIMSAAAKNLTPVTLELGGKSPTLIDPNYNLKTAAKSIIGGKYYNAGQTCIAPDYILVQEKQKQKLVDALVAETKKCFPDILNKPGYTAVINNNHYQRINTLADAASKDCEVVWPLGEEKDDNKNLFPPMFILDPKDDNPVMQGEIFGPLLPIITYKTMDDAIEYINSKANPLTLYLFSNSSKVIKQVTNQTLSGSFAVNETLVQFAQEGVPFGGVGESGMGSYHGQNGFQAFSHMKSVYYQSRINFNGLVRAPYTNLKKKVVALVSALYSLVSDQ